MAVLSCLAAACGTDVVHLQGMAAAPAPRPECVAIPVSASLCVYCGTDYTQQRACLKCEASDPTTGCAPCIWSDMVDGGTCQQCVSPDGTLSTLGCTSRADLQPPASSN